MAYVRLKVCGITNEEDIKICTQAGVDALGFVVEYPIDVPWNINRTFAKKLLYLVPPFITTVLVAGGENRNIVNLVKFLRPDCVQIHWGKDPEEIEELVDVSKKEGVKTVYVLRINASGDSGTDSFITASKTYASIGIDALLVDAFTKDKPGGTGISLDVKLLRKIRENIDVPLIIAGGINSSNVKKYIEYVKPFAIDVISGVEKEKGKKDKEKVEELVKILRS
ncbi:MAG: phosphoribosylanthranilate isomerase [Deltaproteobacteria bacterium]|nr:phosphoribosylanthranilate isomerase [Deltaproteobacteria bacterium]